MRDIDKLMLDNSADHSQDNSVTESKKLRLLHNKDALVTKKEFKRVFEDFMKPRQYETIDHPINKRH
jgi:hypothetical protein